ncbi:MAG TPA: RNA polymerase sigma factor [Candidatus Blautia faecavium]|uniref:RNA polymerase sigma factor n=1 Tax=Candidatus Blautia faecavium TaxID=2838487 RepID=A0A9D2LUM0_9FIRM|nr:RNA polymerase sigma factor [Candidatus Blautia faecavium]
MILFCVIPDEQNETVRLSATIQEEWISRIAEGDMQALEKLYYASYQAVYALLLSILKNQQDAEDILQDTFINIKNGAHLYKKKEGKPLAWIFTIAKNLAYMKIRRETALDVMSMEALRDDGLDFSRVEDHDDRIALEGAFSVLTDEERNIILLHANSGMKHREIASLLNIPLSTVLSKYRRGLKKLKNYMEGVKSGE